MRSSRAHCDPELAKTIGKTLGEEDLREALQKGLAKRIGETLGEEHWRGEGGGGRAALIKSSKPHLAGGEKYTLFGWKPMVFVLNGLSFGCFYNIQYINEWSRFG